MAGWVRSLRMVDGVFYQQPERNAEIGVSSYESAIYFSKLTRHYQVAGIPSFLWSSHPGSQPGLIFASPDLQWGWHLFGMGSCQWKRVDAEMNGFAIPYWLFVVPLTLLSAWLLLSKPKLPVRSLLK
ncbi:hypothetical protein [Schlesneria paludicola]|uniref:hypothetical protein n=1 Tax=Schlesneria paludicola TaxID=360056 RepID=UPI00029A6FC2|nr:hypothetical protein [Schlesneria paludicola]